MNWIIFFFALEIGWLPIDSLKMYEQPMSYQSNQSGYIQFESEVELFKHLFVGGSIRTYISKNKNSYDFWPTRDGYMFYTGLRYDILEIGFRHYCTHPVVPWDYQFNPIWEGAYEEIYFRISGKIGGD